MAIAALSLSRLLRPERGSHRRLAHLACPARHPCLADGFISGGRRECGGLGSAEVQTIHPRRRSAEQVRLLARAGTLRQELAGVPEDCVAVGSLVDREVAL